MLPEKPSALLRVALADMKLCEADPKFSIDMNVWFAPENQICKVCLAGSVMAQTLKTEISEFLCPTDFEYDYTKSLMGLNQLRTGQIASAMKFLNAYEIWKASDFKNPLEMFFSYEEEIYQYINSEATDRPRFYADMESLAQELERIGL